MFTDQSKAGVKSTTVTAAAGGRKPATQKTVVVSEENATMQPGCDGPKPFSASTKGNANALRNAKMTVKMGDAVPAKKIAMPLITFDREVQVDLSAKDLVTGEEATLEYWKKLAERYMRSSKEDKKKLIELESQLEDRDSQIEEWKLKAECAEEKIQILAEENKVLDGMVQEAKKLAEYIESLPDEVSSTDSDDED